MKAQFCESTKSSLQNIGNLQGSNFKFICHNTWAMNCPFGLLMWSLKYPKIMTHSTIPWSISESWRYLPHAAWEVFQWCVFANIKPLSNFWLHISICDKCWISFCIFLKIGMCIWVLLCFMQISSTRSHHGNTNFVSTLFFLKLLSIEEDG